MGLVVVARVAVFLQTIMEDPTSFQEVALGLPETFRRLS